MNTNIYPVPAFRDNYVWLFHAAGSRKATVVDPGDVEPVRAALRNLDLELERVLLTHHHVDHTAGLEELYRDHVLEIVGPKSSRFPLVTLPVEENDRFLANGIEFCVIEVPGHTSDHIAFYGCPKDEPPLLFCGDTLFAGGCGRLFEGTARQMYQSLEKLRQLPDETRVYCAHEYTLDNLAFALSIEPDNQNLKLRLEKVIDMRNKGLPSLPSTIGQEKQTNPFLRTGISTVTRTASNKNNCDVTDPIEVFTILRNLKDNF